MHAIAVRHAVSGQIWLAGMFASAVLMLGNVAGVKAGGIDMASWFPDPPNVKRFSWKGETCEGCEPLAPRHDWRRMAVLAGLGEIRFLQSAQEGDSPAWSAAPNIVVLSPSAMKLPDCQLAFVVGHELVHIAQRHFDEDAHQLMLLSGKSPGWTRVGETAMALLDGNFSLALRMSSNWQEQEREADWVGSLLAAQACGCSLEKGALSYFGADNESGGGLAASHDTDAERMRLLMPFSDSARRLAARVYR